MKKKIFYSISLITSLALLCTSIFFNVTYSPFNADNVKENIAILSSETYGGRLAGSNGNLLVGEIIRKNFEDNKLVPLNEGFKEDFKTTCPINNNSSPYLKVSSEDKVIESLKYGVDYKEDMINFRIHNLNFSKEDKVNIYTNSIEVITKDGNCLFYVAPNNEFSFRSSFINNFPYDMMVLITTNTYNKILDSIREGLTVSVNLPFSTYEKDLVNIVGVLKGSSKNLPPLVLTAHYDHLGQDGLKNTYYGALDNASGTSFLLELQKTLSNYGTPKRDIIFAALNAEEFGLLGSKSFAESNIDKLKGAQVVNFDMIGSKDYPLTLMLGASFKDNESELLKSIEKISKKNNVSTNVIYEDSSDHASFNNLGIDALSFCHSDMSKIHTPNDTVEHISTDAIDSAYNVIEDKINAYCYSPFTVFFHSKASLFIFAILFGFLVSAPFINHIKRRKLG
jgi:aminopeptidase YwaD